MSIVPVPFVFFFLISAENKPISKFPLGKETTYVLEPLDKDGYIDYETALNDRLGKGSIPKQNANALIWKALGPNPEGGKGMPVEFFKRLGIEQPPPDGDYFIDLAAYLNNRIKLDPMEFSAVLDQQVSATTQRPWKTQDYPHIAGWLTANKKPLAVVLEATRRPDYFNPVYSRRKQKGAGSLIGHLLPGVQKCREIAAALTARAMQRVEAGAFDEAWLDLLACHRLGRHIAQGATLIEALVGFAIENVASRADLAFLERAQLNAKQVRGYLKDLQALPPMPTLADKLDLGERFIFLDGMQLCRRGDNAQEEKTMGLIDWEPVLRDGNLFYDRVAAALRIRDRAERQHTLHKIGEELQQVEKKMVERRKEIAARSPLGKLFLRYDSVGTDIGVVSICLTFPAHRNVQDARDRSEQTERNLHIAFALAAYHVDKGRYPTKLDELAPKYLATVPGDLFSGKGLVYRCSEKGYVLYSLGVNGIDEAGHSRDDDPPGDDLGVVMPLPKLEQKK